MATKFQAVRDYIRSALLDHDPSNFQFSDTSLNSQIRLSILQFDNAAIYAEDDNVVIESFTRDLSGKEKLVFVLETAIRILSGIPDTFEWKSPVMQVKRRGGTIILLQKLQEILDNANGGVFAIEADTDFDALMNGITRSLASFNDSLSNTLFA